MSHFSFSGIRKATAWYNTHISINNPPVRGKPKPVLPTAVLLTDDAANRQKAIKEGIPCASGPRLSILLRLDSSQCPPNAFPVRHYVEGTKNASQLLDLISAAGDQIEPTKAVASRQALYPEVGFHGSLLGPSVELVSVSASIFPSSWC